MASAMQVDGATSVSCRTSSDCSYKSVRELLVLHDEPSSTSRQAASDLEASQSLEYKMLPSHRRLWSWTWSSRPGRSEAGKSMESISAFRSHEGEHDAVSWAGQFPLLRGGVVVFTLSAKKSFTIAVGCQADSPDGRGLARAPWLGVRVGSQTAELVYFKGTAPLRVLSSAHFQGAGCGDGERGTFWLSFDPDNRTIKYGKGSRMHDCTILVYSFTGKGLEILGQADQQNIDRLFSPLAKVVQLHDYEGPQIVEHTTFEAPLMEQRPQEAASVMFDPLPLVLDPSPRLLSASQILLSDLDCRDYTSPQLLPTAGQALAQQILHPFLTLESAAEPGSLSLADAIQHSLNTPGGFLHGLLEAKIAALPRGAAREQSQLSISLSPPSGEAPGPSFSLEILPPGHSNAPHDNANTYGALRVLRGYLEVSLFSSDLKVADEEAPLDEVEMDVGDAMWFSPAWYQTHAMRNEAGGYCCYLMARRYAEEDAVRWPYIRSKGHDGEIRSSRVESDCSFRELQATVTAEWAQAVERDPSLLRPAASDLERAASTRTEAWVERTDSALDYTAFLETDKALQDEADKSGRYGCGPFRLRRTPKPQREPQFLMRSCSIPEETCQDLGMLWP